MNPRTQPGEDLNSPPPKRNNKRTDKIIGGISAAVTSAALALGIGLTMKADAEKYKSQNAEKIAKTTKDSEEELRKQYWKKLEYEASERRSFAEALGKIERAEMLDKIYKFFEDHPYTRFSYQDIVNAGLERELKLLASTTRVPLYEMKLFYIPGNTTLLSGSDEEGYIGFDIDFVYDYYGIKNSASDRVAETRAGDAIRLLESLFRNKKNMIYDNGNNFDYGLKNYISPKLANLLGLESPTRMDMDREKNWCSFNKTTMEFTVAGRKIHLYDLHDAYIKVLKETEQ